jgi:hypothetical protein
MRDIGIKLTSNTTITFACNHWQLEIFPYNCPGGFGVVFLRTVMFTLVE